MCRQSLDLCTFRGRLFPALNLGRGGRRWFITPCSRHHGWGVFARGQFVDSSRWPCRRAKFRRGRQVLVNKWGRRKCEGTDIRARCRGPLWIVSEFRLYLQLSQLLCPRDRCPPKPSAYARKNLQSQASRPAFQRCDNPGRRSACVSRMDSQSGGADTSGREPH